MQTNAAMIKDMYIREELFDVSRELSRESPQDHGQLRRVEETAVPLRGIPEYEDAALAPHLRGSHNIENFRVNGVNEVVGVEVAGTGCVTVPTRNLCRSIRFYHRVFGFRIVGETRKPDHPSVLMSAGSNAFLAVCERDETNDPGRSRWSFSVGDIDRARESVWNLGVPVTGGEPRRLRPGGSRSFVVRDPDGHEIVLLES